MKNVIAERHRSIDLPSGNSTRDRLITVDELREKIPFKPSRKSIYNWISSGVIPFQRPKGTRFFLFSEMAIDQWLKGEFIATNTTAKEGSRK